MAVCQEIQEPKITALCNREISWCTKIANEESQMFDLQRMLKRNQLFLRAILRFPMKLKILIKISLAFF